VKKIIKKSLILSTSGTFIRIVSTISGIIVARYLGPVDFGVFSIAREFANVIAPITDFGTGEFLIKEGSQNRKKIPDYLGDLIVYKMIMSIFTIIVAFIVAKLLYNSLIFNITIIFVISAITFYFISLFNSSLMARNNIKATAVSQFSYSFFILVIVLLMVLMKKGIYFLIFGRLLMTIIFVLAIYLIIKKRYNINFNRIINIKKFKYLYNMLLPYGISVVFYLIYMKVIVIILSIMVSPNEVGIFSSAYQIIIGIYFLPGAILRAIFPTLANAYKVDRINYEIKFLKSLKYISIIGMLLSSFLFLFSYYIITILYGNKYELSSNLLLIGSFTIFFKSINVALANGLTFSNNQKYRAKITIYITLILIVITTLLILKYSIIGAILGLLVSEMILFAILFYYINHLVSKVSLLEIWKIPLIILMIVYMLYILFGSFLNI
jgi:O-antigen/teichoic acid export membrane protein